MIELPLNWDEILERTIKELYGMVEKDFTPEYTSLFEIGTATKYQEHWLNAGGTGLMQLSNTGQSVQYDNPEQGYKTTLTLVTYKLGIKVAKELVEDQQMQVVSEMVRGLSTSKNQTIETVAQNRFNNGNSASYPVGDGLALFSTAHLLTRGGTFSNRLTTAASFSVTSVEQAFVDLVSIKQDSGLKMKVMPRKLFIPKNVEWTVRRILQSAQLPDTANNDINPAQGAFPESYMVLHWLTSANDWFFKTDAKPGAKWLWGRRPVGSRDNDFDTDVMKWKLTMRFMEGVINPRSYFGNGGL